MNIFYVDDNRKETAKVSQLGGFIVAADGYKAIQDKFTKLKESKGLTRADPVKWSPPRQKIYAPQRAIPDLNAFRIEILELLAESPIKIVTSIIEEYGKYNKSLRLRYLKNSTEFLAQRLQHEVGAAGFGRIIVEHPGGDDHEIEQMRHYREIRIKGSNYPNFSMKLESLDETIYYTHDFCCDGIQLADFIVGSIGHAIEKKDYSFVRLYKDKIRKVNDKIKGAGIVVYPSSSLIADELINNLQ